MATWTIRPITQALSSDEEMSSPNEHDGEFEYGKIYSFDLEDENNRATSTDLPDIWPNWCNGVPTKLRRTLWSPSFFEGNTHHRNRPYQETVELKWTAENMLAALRENSNVLPSNRRSSEWDGVYRIFSPGVRIERLCGSDPTGTLYLGRAGSERGWSILRTRILQIIRKEHHAIQRWHFNNFVKQRFPWNSLAIQWAYTQKRQNYKGETISGSRMAESFLLDCYNDSYGEYPPLNQQG